VNESDNAESTVEFAKKLLSDLKKLLDNFSISDSDKILESVLIRNITSIKKHIQNKQSKTIDKYKKYILEKNLNPVFINRVLQKDSIDDGIFLYVKEADELYDSASEKVVKV
jgi:hypothetical protein